MKWIGLAAATLLTAACFMPWVWIESRNFTVTGTDSGGTSFGKPGYFHLLLAIVFVICTLTPRVWAKRLNLLITALNVGWALRNFLIIAGCSGGECPVRKTGIWLMFMASALMLLSALFPDMKLPGENKKES